MRHGFGDKQTKPSIDLVHYSRPTISSIQSLAPSTLFHPADLHLGLGRADLGSDQDLVFHLEEGFVLVHFGVPLFELDWICLLAVEGREKEVRFSPGGQLGTSLERVKALAAPEDRDHRHCGLNDRRFLISTNSCSSHRCHSNPRVPPKFQSPNDISTPATYGPAIIDSMMSRYLDISATALSTLSLGTLGVQKV